jgi:hypothetical protein
MNIKLAASDALVGLGIILVVSYAGAYLLRALVMTSEFDRTSLSDLLRVCGPIGGGYYLGRRFKSRGMLAGLVAGIVAAILFEIFNPDWYYREYWYQLILGASANECSKLLKAKVIEVAMEEAWCERYVGDRPWVSSATPFAHILSIKKSE